MGSGSSFMKFVIFEFFATPTTVNGCPQTVRFRPSGSCPGDPVSSCLIYDHYAGR